jgi:hypothetical protein
MQETTVKPIISGILHLPRIIGSTCMLLILVLCGILILPFLFFEQGSENQAVKRRQTRFRTPIRNGGAARMKNFKFASCSCSNPSTTQESARRSVGKVVR